MLLLPSANRASALTTLQDAALVQRLHAPNLTLTCRTVGADIGDRLGRPATVTRIHRTVRHRRRNGRGIRGSVTATGAASIDELAGHISGGSGDGATEKTTEKHLDAILISSALMFAGAEIGKALGDGLGEVASAIASLDDR